MAGIKVRYANPPAMRSEKIPTRPLARSGSSIEIPQPGQNAAVSGMRAAQEGQERGMASVASIATIVAQVARTLRPMNASEPILWIDDERSKA